MLNHFLTAFRYKWVEREEQLKMIISNQKLKILFPFCLILLLSCSASAPDYKTYPKTLTPIENKFQFQNDTCFYYQQYSKIDLHCIQRAKERDKILFLVEFKNLKKQKLLPKLYNKQGETEMNFDSFYRYVK